MRVGREMTVQCTDLCESLNHSFIQHTFLEHLLCVSRCAGAGNREENGTPWNSHRALIEAPSTPAIQGKGGSNSAGELEGSFGLWGARLKVRPSARIQQPPTRPALQSCTRASPVTG